MCLEAIKQEPDALQFVPEHLKSYEVCSEAVKRRIGTLCFVPDSIKYLFNSKET